MGGRSTWLKDFSFSIWRENQELRWTEQESFVFVFWNVLDIAGSAQQNFKGFFLFRFCETLPGEGPGEERRGWLNTSLQKKGIAHTSKWYDCPRRCAEAVDLYFSLLSSIIKWFCQLKGVRSWKPDRSFACFSFIHIEDTFWSFCFHKWFWISSFIFAARHIW